MKYALTAFLLLFCATAEAAKSDYYIVKFGASWCAPCRQMDAEVWPNPRVKDQIKQYKNGKVYYIDVDKDQEWVLKYQVTGVPTILILDGDHKVVRRVMGYLNVEQLVVFLDKDPATAGKIADETFVLGGVTILRWVIILLARGALFILT